MKHKASCLAVPRALLPKKMRQLLYAVTAVSSLTVAGRVEAASQTWTNAPVSGEWTNVLNWVAKAVPGALGVAGGAQNADVVTFTNPLPISGIGGGGSPILNDAGREVNSFIFDGTNCGAYVIGVAGVNALWLSATLFPGGSINVNPAVTNPIAFYAETHFRLQSSQNGGYNITNNATSPSATLYFDVLWADTASSRPLTLTLAGSNTGTNTIRHIDDNAAANGAYHLVKEGSGTWILPQANDIPQKTSGGDNVPASVAVNNGLLIVQDPGSLGTITAANLTVTNTGVLQIDGISLNNAGITLRNGGTVRMNGSAVVNGITVANTVNTVGTLATTHASDVMTVGNAANKVTGGAATTTLRMSGPGTVLFDAANNYVGKFSVDSGTNQIIDPSALGLAANYNINAGGVLDVSPLTTFGATYSLTTKAFSANGTGTTMGTTAATIYLDPSGIFDFGSKAMTLTYTPAATNGDALHPALFAPQGVLNFNGNAITVVNAGSLPLNAGTYQIAHAAGGTVTSSGAFVTIVTGAGLAPGMVGEIVTSGGDLNLLVYAYTPKGLVWTGNDPLVPGVWDRQMSTNWLNGGTPSVFNIYDTALFNVTGISQPNVNLASILVPGGVTVDASAGNYTLTGVGQIAGGTSLIKVGAGTLFLNTANTYSGGTVISNGIIKIGINDAIPSTGLGDVTNVSPAVLDLAGNNDTIGALNGNGTVDVSSGASVLTVGANDNSGTFTGILTNSAGTLGITKVGLGTQVITRSNSYVGNTDIELGTLRVTDPYGIGGGASPLVINGGTLDVATNLFITSLAGTGGTIVNNAATTNMITVTGGSTTTFGGSINSGTGKFALTVLGGSLRMLAANTYSNGTFVGSGATFQIHNSPASVTGALVASNTATLGLSGGSSSPGTPATVTTVDGAAITLTSGAEGEIWGGQFLGTANTTNRFTGPVSAGGIASFSNFLGVVQFALASGNFRFFNGGGVSGGDNTIFEFITGNVHTRDAQTVSLGAVRGGNSTSGIGGNGTGGTTSTWAIGAKNQNNFFEGYINGSNNLVKVGSGTLQLDGTGVVTSTDNTTFTNNVITSLINYLGTTTVSNGTLAVVAPNQLTNCTAITLATPSAVLDASQMGYVINQISVDDNVTPTNSIVVTNGILTVPATTFAGIPQTLAGFGTVKGNGVINNGTINPGSATVGGTLSISNGLTINAGSTNAFDLSDDLTGLVKASDSLTVQGNVTLSGASIISIGALNGVVKVGKYPLIKYSGNLINEGGVVPSGPISNFTLGGLFPATSRATMVLSNAPGEVDLVVVSLNTKNLTWSGDGVSNLWDVVNSFTFTNNGAPIQFYQLDFVTFDNTATNFTALLQGALVPSSITVSNTGVYAFGGSGSIGGTGGLLKTGTGTLLITNAANSFTGGTVISNGLLSVGADSGNNQNDLALGTGPVTVSTAGAELRFGGNGGAVVNHSITNAIILNGGVVKAQDGIQHLTNSTVTVAAGGGSLVTVFATKNLILDSPLQGTGNVTISAVQAGTNAIGGQVILSNALNTISGTVAIAANGNLALIGNAGLSNSPAIDVQTGGVLDVTVRAGAVYSVVSGQTLKGNGVIRGNLNLASGSTLSPGVTGALGTLSATNAATGVNFAGTTVMELNRGATPNSDRLLSTSNQFGGTLTVNNIGGTLLLGDTFTLFTSVTNRGNFAVTNLPVLGSGLGWSNSLTINGKLTVIAVSTVNTNAFILTNSISGNVLTLTWPVDHTGYRLQVQTNSLANGLQTNWVDVPGTTSVNTTNFTINPANGTVFYRLIYP